MAPKNAIVSVLDLPGGLIIVSSVPVKNPLDRRQTMRWDTAVSFRGLYSDGVASHSRGAAAVVHDRVCDIVRGNDRDERSKLVEDVRRMIADVGATLVSP
jgi:hypothetical protein